MAEPTRKPADSALPDWLAIALVTFTSAAVLVLEILAGRLLAPYVGVSLETFTGIIGTILAGIAFGAWVGGRMADAYDPRRLLPVLLVLGGVLAIATVPIVRILGPQFSNGTNLEILLLSAFGFLPSATVLSAVPPAVVKLQLADLSTTGTTVGRLSAYGTGGAILGTFLTGFVLVSAAGVTTLIVTVGVLLILSGLAIWFPLRHGPQLVTGRELSGLVLFGMVATGGAAAIDGPCDTQTRYFCVDVEEVNENEYVLWLDDLRHSYVDLDDPTHLELWYVRRLANAIDLSHESAPNAPVDIVYIGGGGLTLPRYVEHTRPGSQQIVFEIDPDLVDIARDELGYQDSPDIDIRVDDGRLGLAELPDDSADIIVGDAFGSRAVPFHLATQEFMLDIDRVLHPGGIYAANIIDSGSQDFLRSEIATALTVWDYVVVISGATGDFEGVANSVMIASDEPIDTNAIESALSGTNDFGSLVEDAESFATGADTLTDDFAPVDQLID